MKDSTSNKIPLELDETLSEISKVIPVCNVLFDTHLITDIDTLTDNSVLLTSLAEEISQTFKEGGVDYKYTSKERILAGITIDYRHLEDWLSYKTKLEPHLVQRIQHTKKSQPSSSVSKL